jgi:hypothetical protein
MKYLLILSLLVSVVVGVTSHSTPAMNAVTGGAANAQSGNAGNPITNAASAVVHQTDAATRANAEAISQWQQRTAPTTSK